MKFSRAKMQHLKWLRRKELIRINCFIMVAILLMVLLFMGFPIVSNADSPTYLIDVIPDLKYHIIDQVGYLSSESYDSSATKYSTILINESRLNVDFLDGDISNGEYTIDLNGINPSDYPYKYIVADNSNYLLLYFARVNVSDLNLYGGYVTFNSSRYGIFTQPPYVLPSGTSSDSITDYVFFRLRYNSSTNFEYFSYGNFNSSHPYSSYIFGQNLSGFNYANFPLYDLHSVTVPKDNMLIENIDDYPDVNYLLNYTSGPSNSSDIKDHLTLYENSSCYLVPNTMDNGDFYIYANFDQQQKNNPNNYIVCVDCNIYYSFNYNNGATYVSKTNNGQPLKNLFSLNNNAVNTFSTSSRVIRPVSDFNNSKITIPLSEFNQNAVLSNDYSITEIAQALSNTCSDANAFVTVLQAISGFSVMGNKIDLSAITQNGYDCVPVSIYYNFDVSIIYKTQTDVNLSKESSLSYTYDFISGQGNLNYSNLADDQKIKEVTDSQTIPPSYNYDTNKPTYNNNLPSSNNNDNSSNSNSSDNITVSGGDNSINNIVNVNQGNKYPEKGVMQSFVRIINNDKNNTVNDIDTLIGGSAYIQLMNNALVAVPDQVWSIWITALKAILGIAVSAFFLKILINWAT